MIVRRTSTASTDKQIEFNVEVSNFMSKQSIAAKDVAKMLYNPAIFRTRAKVTALIATVVILLLPILYLFSVHRIKSLAELQEILTVLNLPQYNYRCKFANATRYRCLPNIIFIGASKCGTTSLTDYLASHPRVHFVNRHVVRSDPHREVHRFDRSTYGLAFKSVDLAEEWAQSPWLYNPDLPLIHYTPHYLYSPTAPFEIKDFYPESQRLKFIVMLREPIKRALSSYWFQHSHLFTDSGLDAGSLSEFDSLARDEVRRRHQYEVCMSTQRKKAWSELDIVQASVRHRGSPEESLDSQPPVAIRSREDELTVELAALKACFGPSLRSKELGWRHVDKGVYGEQLERWRLCFPHENFFVFTLEEWVQDPVACFRGLLRFIGAESAESDYVNIVKTNFTHKRLVHPNSRADTEPLPPDLKQLLTNFYDPHNKHLEILLNRPLTGW